MCRKELKDWSRDRRSILTVLFSSLLGAVDHRRDVHQPRQPRSGRSRTSPIPVVGAAHAPALMEWLRQQAGVTIVDGPADPEEAVRSRREDVVVVIAEDFVEPTSRPRGRRRSASSPTARASNTRPKVQRVRGLFQRYSNEIGSLRLIARGVSPVVASPLQIEDVEVSSAQQRAATLLGFIPLFIMISAFTGAHAARHRFHRRRARARLDRGAAGESRAARGDRRRQVAGRHAHGDAERDGERRAAVRAVPIHPAAGPRHPLPPRRNRN